MKFLKPDGTPHKELNETIAAQSRIIRGWRSSRQQKSEALFERGKILYSVAAMREAIADCTRAIKLGGAESKVYVEALLLRGGAYYRRGELDLALADHERVLETADILPAQRGQALYSRAFIFFRRGEMNDALSGLTAAAEDWKTEPDKWPCAVLLRANVLHALGRTEEALSDCAQVLGASGIPDRLRAGCYTSIGFTRFDAYGDVTSLVENAARAFELDNTQTNIKGNFGLAKLFSGEPEKALEHYLPAIAEMTFDIDIDGDIRAIEKHRGLVPAKCADALEEILAALRAQKEDLRLV